MEKAIVTLAGCAIAALAVISPAWAGTPPPATPAPVLGLGIPALALFGLAYRKLRSRGEG